MNAGDELLPTSLEVGGRRYAIRSDYRTALDILLALTDPEHDAEDRALTLLCVLFKEEIPVGDLQEAVEKGLWFLNGGDEERNAQAPKLVDWRQDFKLIVAPINRVMGAEIRAVKYLHWWTFLSAYLEIGDCLFAQVVAIRSKKAQGKPLSKEERAFYRRNRDLVDIRQTASEAEKEILKEWM